MNRFYYPLLSILTIFIYKIIEASALRIHYGSTLMIEDFILFQEHVMVKVFGILLCTAVILVIDFYFEISIKIKKKFKK